MTNPSIETLLQLPKFGNGVGLHRMSLMCADLLTTDWISTLETIRVTGSNGKGSVCAMIASILNALGISVGLYTSPHLLQFNERIVINNQPISDEALLTAITWFLNAQDRYLANYPTDDIGVFEAITAIALYHYTQHKPHLIIAEAGIGGRFDSTRIIPGNLVGLSSLDLEHTKLLGHTLELIAYDKVDLCPDYGTLVVGNINKEVLRRITEYCRLRHINLISVDQVCKVLNVEFSNTHMTVDMIVDNLQFSNLKITLQGYHQISNAAVAILLVREWLRKKMPILSMVANQAFIKGVQTGLSTVVWPGRFQKIHHNPDIFIDVGHSPDAIACLVETVKTVLKNKDTPLLVIMGVSYNKEVEQITATLLSIANSVICTQAYHRGSPVSKIVELVKTQATTQSIFQADTIEEAMHLAKELAQKNNMTILVAGSLFLAVEAMQVLQGKNPKALNFL